LGENSKKRDGRAPDLSKKKGQSKKGESKGEGAPMGGMFQNQQKNFAWGKAPSGTGKKRWKAQPPREKK